MAKTLCPICESLVGIMPTGEHRHPTRGTDKWWRVDMHKHPDKEMVCDGSGKKV
jgi:hypothetical protein